MDITYEKFLKSGLDLSCFGVRPGGTEPYFCTPRGAVIIGCEGVNGVHYCFAPGYGDTVFSVNPSALPGDFVRAVARSFADFLRLLLGCGYAGLLEQAGHFDDGELLRAAGATRSPECEAAKDAIRREFGLEPIEDFPAYLRELRGGFDYSRIEFTDPDCDGEAPEPSGDWAVYYDGGLSSRGRGGAPGEEIRLDRRYFWAGREVRIPAVYSCAKGLVADIAVRAETADVLAFMERWGLTAESRPSDFTLTERRRMDAENPLNFRLDASLTVNGVTLRRGSASGAGWIPIDGVESPGGARDFVEHYELERGCCWAVHRIRFPWPRRRMELDSLIVRLSAERAELPGEAFTVASAGDTVELRSPFGGEAYTLTVMSIEPVEAPAETRGGWEYPRFGVAMAYTLSPEPEGEAPEITDTAETEKARRKRCDGTYETRAGAIFALISDDAEDDDEYRAVSAMHFAPPERVEWIPVFKAPPCEPFARQLI